MRPDRLLVTALTAALTATGAVADIPTQSGLSMYFARMVATALPYREESRWDAYQTIARIAEALFHEEQFSADIATLQTDTFDAYPLLFLTDEDGDQRADFFAYHENEEREFTREFGAYFTVGESTFPAWIVFNNGTIPEEFGADVKDWVFFWATHHFVDRNGDGRFDLYIGSGNDPDGDGKTGVHETEWAFDDDFDGRLDRGEVNISGEVRAVKPDGGVFPFPGIGALRSDVPTYVIGDAFAADILNALEGVDR